MVAKSVIPVVILNAESVERKLRSWPKVLTTPLWYKKIISEMLKWEEQMSNEELGLIKSQVYHLFEEKLSQNKIFLAKTGPNYDKGRKPIDTIVIHHTAQASKVTWQRLSAVGLLRQYAVDYYKFDHNLGQLTVGQPIWSGHFRQGQPVFYAYHWLVRDDGSFERLLEDNYMGWQAGNLEVNQRSVAVVFDGNFTNTAPSDQAISAAAQVITSHYPNVAADRIFGHREVNPKTICPGDKFEDEWKDKLIERIHGRNNSTV